MAFLAACVAASAIVLLLVLRIYWILPSGPGLSSSGAEGEDGSRRQIKRPPVAKAGRHPRPTRSLAIFMGSGGHTAEMTTLVSTLDFARYTPRRYIVCHGDEMSLKAIARVEGAKGGVTSSNYSILSLPRARNVGQPLFSSLRSTALTLISAFLHLFLRPLFETPTEPYSDVLLINGPGTCVVLVAIAYIRRVLGMGHSKIIYVESFARVKSLSLSGRLLRRVVDCFVVQWSEAGGVAGSGAGAGEGTGAGRTDQMGRREISSEKWSTEATGKTGQTGPKPLRMPGQKGRTVWRGWLV